MKDFRPRFDPAAHLEWFQRWLGGEPPPWSVEEFADNAVFDRETGRRIDVGETVEPARAAEP